MSPSKSSSRPKSHSQNQATNKNKDKDKKPLPTSSRSSRPQQLPYRNQRGLSGTSQHYSHSRRQSERRSEGDAAEDDEIDVESWLAESMPLSLQQLVLNCFKEGLLSSSSSSSSSSLYTDTSITPRDEREAGGGKEVDQMDIMTNLKPLIQEIKAHLYNRDFDAAFTAARPDLLRAYALRWSASRALGYMSLMRGAVRLTGLLHNPLGREDDDDYGQGLLFSDDDEVVPQVLCIGGGAGAEIMALAAAWRDLVDEAKRRMTGREEEIAIRESTSANDSPSKMQDMLLESRGQVDRVCPSVDDVITENGDGSLPLLVGTKTARVYQAKKLCVTAVDIADWSNVVETLSHIMQSSAVTSSKAHPAPLVPSKPNFSDKTVRDALRDDTSFNVSFWKADILNQTDQDMQDLLNGISHSLKSRTKSIRTILVTMMFTLNELFSSSMAKTTQFLLTLTDTCAPGMVLLVVDSPGSYSTLALGGGASPSNHMPNADQKKDEGLDGSPPDPAKSQKGQEAQSQQQQRTYPMKFLLDHTLLSVAAGKWKKIVSEDSLWFRREASKLRYDVGEGAALEDMRFQVHIYRRLDK